METIAKFMQYLEAQREACLHEAAVLKADSRQDEANLMKVRANIFDIFSAVCRAARQHAPGDSIAFVQGKMETIPEAWQTALQNAQTHADSAQAAVEAVKLDTAAKLRKVFLSIQEAQA